MYVLGWMIRFKLNTKNRLLFHMAKTTMAFVRLFGLCTHLWHGVHEVAADDDELWPRLHPVDDLDRPPAELDLGLPDHGRVLLALLPVSEIVYQTQLRVRGLN